MEQAPEPIGKQLTREVNKNAKKIAKVLPKPPRKKIGAALAPDHVPDVVNVPMNGSAEGARMSLADKARARMQVIRDEVEARRSPSFVPEEPTIGHLEAITLERTKGAREKFLQDSVREANEERARVRKEIVEQQVNEDIAALQGTIVDLQQSAKEAESRCDVTLSQQLQEASRALVKKMNEDYVAIEQERTASQINMIDSYAHTKELKGQLAEQEHEEEAEGLLKRLAATREKPKKETLEDDIKVQVQEVADSRNKKTSVAEETSEAQWEQHYKDEEAKNKPTPNIETPIAPAPSQEGYADFNEKLTKAVKERGIELGKNTPEAHKSFIRGRVEAFNKHPILYKTLIASALFGGSVAAGLIAGPAAALTWGLVARGAAGGLAGFIAGYSATKDMENRFKARWITALTTGAGAGLALALPSFIRYLDHSYLHIGDWLSNHGFSKTGSPEFPSSNEDAKGDKWNPLDYRGTVPPVPGYVDALFNKPFSVQEGDNVWNLLKAKLQAGNIINSSMSEGVVNKKLALLQNKLDALGPDGIKDLLHIRSGNIHLIRPGETIDFSIIDKRGWLNDIK